MLRRLPFCCLAIILSASAAWSAPIAGCHTRDYSADHMQKNPRQLIRKIVFERLPEAEPIQIGITAFIKGDKRRWDAGGSCTAESDVLNCGLDGDSGRVRVSPTAQGVRIDVIEGISFEADAADGGLDRKAFNDAAHRSFLLTRAPASACK